MCQVGNTIGFPDGGIKVVVGEKRKNRADLSWRWWRRVLDLHRLSIVKRHANETYFGIKRNVLSRNTKWNNDRGYREDNAFSPQYPPFRRIHGLTIIGHQGKDVTKEVYAEGDECDCIEISDNPFRSFSACDKGEK